MYDLNLDEDLQPVFAEKDIDTLYDDKAFEQWIKIEAESRLYDILRTPPDQAERRIRLEISRIIDETDYLQSVEEISVSQRTDDSTGYDVEIYYEAADSFSVLLN